MVVSAKDIKARVKAQLAEQMERREAAALAVVAACERLDTARQQLTAAEADLAAAAAAGVDAVGVKDLAQLTGLSESALRRHAKAAAVIDLTEEHAAEQPAGS